MDKNKTDQFENINLSEINTNDFGTLAIDLGSSTTVVVFQKENGQPPELLNLPPISRAPGEIPSLIWKSSEKEDCYLIGQQIIDLGEDKLIDNETFLGHFKGISVTASANNTILYLNPQGSKTSLSIYYHNSQDDSLALNLQLNNDATHVNVFNTKEDATIINDSSRIYIQSMAGYRANIMIKNLDSIKEILKGKAINKVTMRFDVEDDSQLEYVAHEKMFLVRVDQFGNYIFLTDYTIEGESHFGGRLDENKYVFNITRFFVQLLNNNSFTNELYLLPSGSVINANRTILNNDITLEVYYSQL